MTIAPPITITAPHASVSNGYPRRLPRFLTESPLSTITAMERAFQQTTAFAWLGALLLSAVTGCHPLGGFPSYRLPPSDALEPTPVAPTMENWEDCESCGRPAHAPNPCPIGLPVIAPAWWPSFRQLPLPGDNMDEAPWPRFHPVPTRPVFEPPPEEIAPPSLAPAEELPQPPSRLKLPPRPEPLPPSSLEKLTPPAMLTPPAKSLPPKKLQPLPKLESPPAPAPPIPQMPSDEASVGLPKQHDSHSHTH